MDRAAGLIVTPPSSLSSETPLILLESQQVGNLQPLGCVTVLLGFN